MPNLTRCTPIGKALAVTILVGLLSVFEATTAGALPVEITDPGYTPDQMQNARPVTAVPPLLLAQSNNPDLPPEKDSEYRRLTDADFDRLDERIRDIRTLCSRIPINYLIDCIADQYETIARSLPDNRDSRALKLALGNAGRKLAQISLCNPVDAERERDCLAALKRRTIMPRATIGSKTVRSSRPLHAIRKRHLEVAKAEATAILDELSTVLLRSAENSSRRQEQYARIVQAIDSNKVLLRS